MLMLMLRLYENLKFFQKAFEKALKFTSIKYPICKLFYNSPIGGNQVFLGMPAKPVNYSVEPWSLTNFTPLKNENT